MGDGLNDTLKWSRIYGGALLVVIDAIEAGLTDVSCGYDALYKQLAPGKGKQYQITGNHLAVGTDRGRAGSRCAIGDSAPLTKGSNMKQLNWFLKLAVPV